MVETKSTTKKGNPKVMEKKSKKTSNSGLKNSRKLPKSSSETVSKNSFISRLYTVLNYFSNYFQYLRENLGNTTIFINFIVTGSTYSDSKKKQIPKKRNENVSSKSSSYYTKCVWLIGLVAATYTSYYIYTFFTSTQSDLDPKMDNNLPTVPLGKIQSIQDQNRDFDIKNYLMDLFNHFKNFLFNTNKLIVGVGMSSITCLIFGYGLSRWISNCSPSTGHNDNDPCASRESLSNDMSRFQVTSTEGLSDSSENSATLFFRTENQETNNNKNFLTPNSY